MRYQAKEIFSIPNLMGYARILLIPFFVISYLNAESFREFLLPSFLLIVSSFLDLFDGMIARKFDLVTDIGKMLDPIADKITQAAVALCLATRYPLMIPLLSLMLIKELYMGLRGLFHLKRGGTVYGATRFGKVCTATLFISFSILVLFPYIQLLLANLLILVCIIVMLITLILYLRYFHRLKKEPDRREKKSKKQHPIRMACTLLFGVLFAGLLYLLIGVIAPFAVYQKITPETIAAFDADTVFDHAVPGERVALLEKNSTALEERIRLMNLAEERIIISTFDVRDGKAIRDMAAVMLERANQGVKIEFLVDAFGMQLHMRKSVLIDALAAHPNIEFRIYNPIDVLTPWTSQGRMHDKYVIVDDFAYIIGGRNTFDYFLTDDAENGSFDRELLIYEGIPSAQTSLSTLEGYFYGIWHSELVEPYREDPSHAKREDVKKEINKLTARYREMKSGEYAACFSDTDYISRTYETSGVVLLSNPTHIYGKEPILFHCLTEMMATAESRVMIHTPYAVLNDYMCDRLRYVCREVPNVSMMLNGIENGDNLVASSDYLYNKDKVLSTGIRLLEYQGGKSYHSKSVLIDHDISIVGSFNFDLRSTYMDTELMVAVKSEALNTELSAAFASYEQFSCEQFENGEQFIPANTVIEELSTRKEIIYHFLGLLLQPFRFLI